MQSPLVFDNIIQKADQDNLEKLILDNANFPWYYTSELTTGNTGEGAEVNPGLGHIAFSKENGPNSFIFENLQAVLSAIAQKINISKFDLLRIRVGMNLPNNTGGEKINKSHIDFEIPHITALYYLNDTDGDTILYDPETYNIMMRVRPKKGRVLIFNGQQFHSSSSSSHNTRVVITYNFTI